MKLTRYVVPVAEISQEPVGLVTQPATSKNGHSSTRDIVRPNLVQPTSVRSPSSTIVLNHHTTMQNTQTHTPKPSRRAFLRLLSSLQLLKPLDAFETIEKLLHQLQLCTVFGRVHDEDELIDIGTNNRVRAGVGLENHLLRFRIYDDVMHGELEVFKLRVKSGGGMAKPS